MKPSNGSYSSDTDHRRLVLQIAHLQSVCEKKSVCVRELQHSQECVVSRLEESVRRREEAWSSQHEHTVAQLQVTHTQPSGVSSETDLQSVDGAESADRTEEGRMVVKMKTFSADCPFGQLPP